MKQRCSETRSGHSLCVRRAQRPTTPTDNSPRTSPRPTGRDLRDLRTEASQPDPLTLAGLRARPGPARHGPAQPWWTGLDWTRPGSRLISARRCLFTAAQMMTVVRRRRREQSIIYDNDSMRKTRRSGPSAVKVDERYFIDGILLPISQTNRTGR